MLGGIPFATESNLQEFEGDNGSREFETATTPTCTISPIREQGTRELMAEPEGTFVVLAVRVQVERHQHGK